MNPDPEAKDSVRMTVTTTAIIINMLVVLVLEEVYGAVAVWLTELGTLLKAFLKACILFIPQLGLIVCIAFENIKSHDFSVLDLEPN